MLKYRVVIATAAGALLIAILATAYYLVPAFGGRIDRGAVEALAVILASGASLAAFLLVALSRPAGTGPMGQMSPLNADPVKDFIARFRQPEPLVITARPGMSVGEMTVRLGNLLDKPENAAGRRILVIVKAAKKGMHNPVVLKDLFEKLKPFAGFYHLLLMSENDKFVGYIPREAALKEFTGENGETKISKFIVDVLADPSKSTMLRKMKGAAREDMILDTSDIREAARKFRLDANNLPRNAAEPPLQGLVVYHYDTPVGFLEKDDIFVLSTTGAA